MIHAIAESIPPVRLAFAEEFPEAEVVNVLDEGLLFDFDDVITPLLRRRMSNLIRYCQDNQADAIGLACSVYAPVVDSARDLVDVPLVSSYGPVMADAVAAGPRIGLIASVAAALRDSEHYLKLAAEEAGKPVEPKLCLAEDLITVMRAEGQSGLERRLEEEVMKLAPDVDVVLLGQFSFAAALEHLQKVSPVPVLSALHSSARTLKRLLS
jgi:Asp/Glu/hydantoin racemase|tara:strand:+ start:2528 stop:3160 length:633 start_codon:yes stop_codon:yes gene_type:complete